VFNTDLRHTLVAVPVAVAHLPAEMTATVSGALHRSEIAAALLPVGFVTGEADWSIPANQKKPEPEDEIVRVALLNLLMVVLVCLFIWG